MGKLKKSPRKKKISLSPEKSLETMKKGESMPSVIRIRRTKVKKLVIGAVLGYFGGVLLTYMWFLFFATQMHFPLRKSTNLGIALALVLTIGLAFNRTVRCIVILILPNFFSAKGRSALVAYSFVLAMTGPTANILKNVDALSVSLSCGQEQLKEALQGMLEVVKQPLRAIKNAVKIAVQAMKKTLEKIEKVMNMIKNLIIDILKGIQKAFEWLGSVVNICNKQMGTPYKRCMDLFEEARRECVNRMGILKFMCNVTYLVETICYAVKFIDFICILVDFVSDAIVGTVKQKLKQFVQEIRNMFYVTVKFDHKFNFTTQSSKNLSQIGADILADIKKRSRGVFFVMGWMEILAGLIFLRIVLKAVIYKSKYEHNDRFDNTYITKDFLIVDGKRREMGKETALPLTRKEGRKYIQITSCYLVKAEKLKLARSAMFLMITTIQIATICVVDYSLFNVLWTIREHGRKMAGIETPDMITVNVSGNGFIAEIYDGIIKAFSPMAEKYDMDPIPCLPNPSPPKYDRYFEIGIMIMICWALLIFEPYGLRLRQIIMRSFYPERAKERAVWLHAQILMRRTSFLKFARRKARLEFGKNKKADNVSFLDWLRANTDKWWIMRKILGKSRTIRCMLCASPIKKEEDTVRCPRPGCKGTYCRECFKDMENTCFLCSEPVEYGDFSDISEEKDSSDEPDEVITAHDLSRTETSETQTTSKSQLTSEPQTSSEPRATSECQTSISTRHSKSTSSRSGPSESVDTGLDDFKRK